MYWYSAMDFAFRIYKPFKILFLHSTDDTFYHFRKDK